MTEPQSAQPPALPLDASIPESLAEFVRRFPTERSCEKLLRRWKYGDAGFRCPHCSGQEAWYLPSRRLDECRGCGKQTSLTAGTLFHKSTTPLRTWFLALRAFTASKQGISATELSRELGISYPTAWTWLHKMRSLVLQRPQEPLSGVVEADETLEGGRESGAVEITKACPTGTALENSKTPTESYEWAACGAVLGRPAFRLVDPARSRSLLHLNEPTAREALRDAMAARVAPWQAERAEVDAGEEPGCRGVREGCSLVHAARRPRDAGEASHGEIPARAHTAGRKPGSVSRERDERMDQQARLRVAGWRAADMIGPVCACLGADPVALPAACHRPAESTARAPIARVASDGAGVPAVAVADLLRVSGAAVSTARLRREALRPARGWSYVDVLSRRAPGC